MKISSFSGVSEYLDNHTLKLNPKDSYSLDRIKSLLDKLDNPQDKLKVVHIAGTSGKTSTCYYLAKLLSLNGYKTGLSVSPHIEEINERVQVDLKPLSEEEFCDSLSEFTNILDSFEDELTYFELFVAFAFWYFAKAKVDYVVIEVGLGGLLDATNVVSREDKICVITDIGLDHTEVLGTTIQEITSQKTGIVQEGNKVFCNRQDDLVIDQIKQAVKAKNAELSINPTNESKHFNKRNFSLAEFTAGLIFKQDSKPQLSDQQLEEARELAIPGRLEKFYIKGKTIVLDGAHNTQKIENLLQALQGDINPVDCCFVLAVGENKKSHLLRMSQAISKYASHVVLTDFEASQDFKHQSLSPGYLKSYFEGVSAEKVFGLDKAVEKALTRPEKIVVFTGSLYLIGPVREKLNKFKS